MRAFDPLSCPLEGRNLLEASAGTGKTYALAALYLRLLLERELPVGELLVVTFTEAATEELRDRIRRRLREGLRAFASAEAMPSDAFLRALVERCPDRARAVAALAAALANFDEAAIFTIHGFCARVLSENAFECGSSFDAELVPDTSALGHEVVEDFWRVRLFGESPDFLEYLQEEKGALSPEALLRLLEEAARKPELSILPEGAAHDPASVEEACRQAFARVRRAWSEGESDVCRILLEDPGLDRRRYAKRYVPNWIEQLREYVCGGSPHARFDNFRRFCATELADVTREGSTAPQHPFFERCDELRCALEGLREAFARKVTALKADFLRSAREELRRRKREKNLRCYDDLLLDVKLALDGPAGGELAATLRRRYRAALIDEFQDTDSVQYAIFRRAFGEGEALFFIGDPKQAIYGFRGADVFSYFAAADEAEARHTLGTNWRSDPRLVTAVNALFTSRSRPFHLAEIPFVPAGSGRTAEEVGLTIDGSPDPSPFRLWFAERPEGRTSLGKEEGARRVAEAVSTEIALLLAGSRQGRVRLGGSPLAPADVAVLVRSNRQAALIQQALGARGVPSVLQSTGSLFESREAEDAFRLLRALAEPRDEGRIRAALLTDTFGVRGEELAALLADEERWTARLESFREYHDLWLERGILGAARVLLVREHVRERLLPLPDGERRLTNLLHCFEALHRAAAEDDLGPERLVRWLAAQLRDPSDAEEHQLRLETDAEAVRVVTIHRSKGLEYPVVFCPYCWGGVRDQDGPVSFHGSGPDRGEFLDLGSAELEAHRQLAAGELLSEDLRLLYVAVTRAKARCYLVWGAFRDAERSGLGYLLDPPPLSTCSDEELLADLRSLAARAGGTMEVVPLPRPGSAERFDEAAGPGAGLSVRTFRGRVPEPLRISSFTALASSSPEPDRPDRDERTHSPRIEVPPDPASFLGFPRGARAGQCLHEIFEGLDFARSWGPETEAWLAAKLSEHAFEPSWVDVVHRMVEHVLAAPLPETGGFSLGRLRAEDRAHELEFLFPCAGLTPRGLAEFFRSRAATELSEAFGRRLAELGFARTNGFLKGFIDLVFRADGRYYLLDWKSNFLGADPADYAADALGRAMVDECYVLQYHLYALALHKHLGSRVPGYDYDAHFGGVYYLFLRGVRPDQPGAGIFYDRPSRELLGDFGRLLANELPERRR